MSYDISSPQSDLFHSVNESKMIQTDGERHTIFLDWKNQYCQNDYTTQGNLQSQCDPYQITNGIFHLTRAKSLSFTILLK